MSARHISLRLPFMRGQAARGMSMEGGRMMEIGEMPEECSAVELDELANEVQDGQRRERVLG